MDARVIAHRFTIGRTLKGALWIFRRHIILFGCAVIATRFIVSWTIPYVPLGGDENAILWISAAVQLLSNFLMEALAAAIVVFGTIEALRGRKPSFRDLLRGISYLHLIFAGGLVMGGFQIAATVIIVIYPADSDMVTLGQLAVGLGTLLLFLIWGLYVPAIALEGKGLWQAMHRSYRLTEGRRGTIFLLLLIVHLAIVFLLTIGPQVVIRAVIELTSAFDMMHNYSPAWIGPFIVALLGLISTVTNILPVVIYHHLRIEKEGDDTYIAARVFD
jgi:hypothetical protein